MFNYFFDWYHGQVWANLLASAITGGLAATWSVSRVRKHANGRHQELMGHISKIHRHLNIKE